MRNGSKTHTRLMLSAAVCLAAGAGAALAALDGWELSSHDVRNAYFLGQRRADQQLYQFLASYQQRLAATSQGPQVWSVEISTPYHQVVQRSLRSPNYSAQQAQRDYDRLGDRIVVTAQVSLPLARVYTFGDSRIWDAFDLHLVQDGRRIVPGQLRREPVYSFGENSTLTGFLLRAEFSVRQVARGPVRVEVVTDQNDAVGTQFDLARLR